jgi:hypothetical protein
MLKNIERKRNFSKAARDLGGQMKELQNYRSS